MSQQNIQLLVTTIVLVGSAVGLALVPPLSTPSGAFLVLTGMFAMSLVRQLRSNPS